MFEEMFTGAVFATAFIAFEIGRDEKTSIPRKFISMLLLVFAMSAASLFGYGIDYGAPSLSWLVSDVFVFVSFGYLTVLVGLAMNRKFLA